MWKIPIFEKELLANLSNFCREREAFTCFQRLFTVQISLKKLPGTKSLMPLFRNHAEAEEACGELFPKNREGGEEKKVYFFSKVPSNT